MALPEPNLPPWMDRYKASRIAQLRAVGYGQDDIAHQVGLSQQSVSRYLQAINESAKKSGDMEGFLLALILIAAGAALVAMLSRGRA